MRGLRSASDCAAQIEALYGPGVGRAPPVLHVTALWRALTGERHTLRIVPATPRSHTDRFVLGVARARADAILCTGKILREEPGLRHVYLDDPEEDRAMAAWRRETLGRADRPQSVVLSSGHGLDWRHPLFRDESPAWVYTGEVAASSLRREVPRGVRVIASAAPGVRAALSFLAGEGLRVAVEAGASTTRDLYRTPVAVDEVMLSEFLGDSVPVEVVGPRFEVSAILERDFYAAAAGESLESSGPWRFARYLRRSPSE